jgi:uncharacterized protein (DUF362 family)
MAIGSAMLDQAMAALGGIGVFVKPGQTVLIKPNIGWDAPPERGANTHPDLVAHLVRLCLGAGAKSVSIFDKTCDQWQRTYANSGIEKAAKEAGAIVINGNDRECLPRGCHSRRSAVEDAPGCIRWCSTATSSSTYRCSSTTAARS